MPSEAYGRYLDQCRLLHETRKTFSGNGILNYLPDLVRIAEGVNAKTMLDYGCGKGLQYGKMFQHPYEEGETSLDGLRGWTITKYDPAVPQFAAKPTGQFDLVICTHVLECIPESDIPMIAQELTDLAGKGLLVAVAAGASKKRFPNGENAHITQKPANWWHATLRAPTRVVPNFTLIVD